jgi:hypothetical protein
VHDHREVFEANPRSRMMTRLWDGFEDDRQAEHLTLTRRLPADQVGRVLEVLQPAASATCCWRCCAAGTPRPVWHATWCRCGAASAIVGP